MFTQSIIVLIKRRELYTANLVHLQRQSIGALKEKLKVRCARSFFELNETMHQRNHALVRLACEPLTVVLDFGGSPASSRVLNDCRLSKYIFALVVILPLSIELVRFLFSCLVTIRMWWKKKHTREKQMHRKYFKRKSCVMEGVFFSTGY